MFSVGSSRPLAAAQRPARHCRSGASLRRATTASAAGHHARKSFNFSAGPACLPLEVLEQAQAEMLDWHGSGMSVLEMSHRGPEFESIIAKAEKDLRALMKVPDNYKASACGAAATPGTSHNLPLRFCLFRAAPPPSSQRCP